MKMEEIVRQIELLDTKIERFEVGSVQRNIYQEIRAELVERLEEMQKQDNNKLVRLHKEEQAVCESCQ